MKNSRNRSKVIAKTAAGLMAAAIIGAPIVSESAARIMPAAPTAVVMDTNAASCQKLTGTSTIYVSKVSFTDSRVTIKVNTLSQVKDLILFLTAITSATTNTRLASTVCNVGRYIPGISAKDKLLLTMLASVCKSAAGTRDSAKQAISDIKRIQNCKNGITLVMKQKGRWEVSLQK